MTTLPSVQFPLRVIAKGEAVMVVDAIGACLSYCYFEEEAERRLNTKRVTKDEAVEIGRAIARALTDAFGPTSGPAPRS